MVNGKQGLFPSNFVELIEEEPEAEKIGESLHSGALRLPHLVYVSLRLGVTSFRISVIPRCGCRFHMTHKK